MSSKLNIFFTGATGYIGGTVLTRLLRHPDAASFQITALVRSAEKGEKLKTLGVDFILGSYTDENLDLLTEAASKADVVIAVADADNLPASNAILAGMKIKHEKSGKAPVLIHTSGTGILMDDARGLHGDLPVVSDLEVDKLNALPVEAQHRDVDIPIIEADRAGHIKSYIIAPGTIFGVPSGPLVDLGIQNKSSVQLPYFIKPALVRKQGGYIGKGLNKWSAVDVEETADLYRIIFDSIRSNPDAAGHGSEGYYFVENTVYSGLEVGRAISEALVDLGIGTSREPNALSQEECVTFYGNLWPLLATNSLVKADRGRALGWNPKQGKAEFIASVKPEVAALLAKAGNQL
ncbi:hypothetical protein BDZ97DRAFT_1670608 [Flammula alnicola]|nr:hypothetical protein BDZ97DRAFT_1670608 [Flammula alnicola]